ncbi:MAG: hypothetical protein GY756_12740, partial [bacterium]|nr:hypothetical protein [bacterium]
ILQSGFEPSKVNIGSNGEKLRSISQYGFHSLRYMFITACARSGVSIEMVKTMVGHLNEKQTQAYLRFKSEDIKIAMSTFSLKPDDVIQKLRQRAIININLADSATINKIIKLLFSKD